MPEVLEQGLELDPPVAPVLDRLLQAGDVAGDVLQVEPVERDKVVGFQFGPLADKFVVLLTDGQEHGDVVGLVR